MTLSLSRCDRYTPALRLCCLLACLLCAALQSKAQMEFDYRNPTDSPPLRDPQITKVGGEWYMTATAAPFFEQQGQSPGVNIWRSGDLTHRTLVALAVKPSKEHWYKERFWAPELFPYKGKWYLTFNCPYPNIKGPQSVALAVADRITGPFRVLTKDKPLAEGNDATLFAEDDGRVVPVHRRDLRRAGRSGACHDGRQALPGGLRRAQRRVGRHGEGGPDVGVEGPSLFKHAGAYYVLYASWGRGYEEGYATAPAITGPWTKFAGNPIYGAQDKPWTALYKHSYTQLPNVPYTQVGQGSPFVGPDGRLWFGCHGYLTGKGQQSHLVITPVTFDNTGTIHMTLTWTLQRVPLRKPFRLHLSDVRLATPLLDTLVVSGVQ